MSKPLDDDLAAARRAFAAWRRTRSGRGRIPDRLWALALRAAEQYAPSRVARALGLSPERLRKRQQAAPPGLAFLELGPGALVAAASPLPAPIGPSELGTADAVHALVERADGARLSVLVPASAPGALEALVTSFLRAPQ